MTRALLAAAFVCALPVFADSKRQEFSDFTTPLPVKPGETLAIGVVGGWERWDNPARCTRRTAIAIKRKRLAGVHVETVENHSLDLAEELVHKAFDFDGDGKLGADEAARARVVVFGQSLGGRAAIWLARKLDALGIRVPLLIVVDAYGKDTYVVPPNVAAAANWYQRDHIVLKGAPEIRAADPSRTKILGNWRVTYKGRKIDASDDTAAHRIFMGAHTLMEHDREVWDKVEAMLAGAVGGGE